MPTPHDMVNCAALSTSAPLDGVGNWDVASPSRAPRNELGSKNGTARIEEQSSGPCDSGQPHHDQGSGVMFQGGRIEDRSAGTPMGAQHDARNVDSTPMCSTPIAATATTNPTTAESPTRQTSDIGVQAMPWSHGSPGPRSRLGKYLAYRKAMSPPESRTSFKGWNIVLSPHGPHTLSQTLATQEKGDPVNQWQAARIKLHYQGLARTKIDPQALPSPSPIDTKAEVELPKNPFKSNPGFKPLNPFKPNPFCVDQGIPSEPARGGMEQPNPFGLSRM